MNKKNILIQISKDAHNSIIDFDSNTSFFAVYDGHGGSSIFLKIFTHFKELLKQ